jgi:UDP-N-acetylglucosamine 2-epimerase
MTVGRKRILSVTSRASEILGLAALWQAFAGAEGFDLHVLALGAHAEAPQAVRDALPERAKLHLPRASAGRPVLDGVFLEVLPDLLVLTGGGPGMALPTAPGVALAHIGGGAQRQDRDADDPAKLIIKRAHLHLAASVPAAERIAAMGEEPWRIAVTGLPALDRLRAAPVMSREDLAGVLDMDDIEGLILVAARPESGTSRPTAALDAILTALEGRPAPVLILGAGTGPEARDMRRAIETFIASRPRARFIEGLIPDVYAAALRHARVMVGNSSSGILTAEFFGLPVIDVGNRQAHRDRGPNVVLVPAQAPAVLRALYALPARGPEGRGLYGDGQATLRMLAAVRQALRRPDLLHKKAYSGPASFTAPWTPR